MCHYLRVVNRSGDSQYSGMGYAYDKAQTIVLTEQEFIDSLRTIAPIAKKAGYKFSFKTVKTNGYLIKWPIILTQDNQEIVLGGFNDQGKIEIHWSSDYHKIIKDPHWFFNL